MMTTHRQRLPLAVIVLALVALTGCGSSSSTSSSQPATGSNATSSTKTTTSGPPPAVANLTAAEQGHVYAAVADAHSAETDRRAGRAGGGGVLADSRRRAAATGGRDRHQGVRRRQDVAADHARSARRHERGVVQGRSRKAANR